MATEFTTGQKDWATRVLAQELAQRKVNVVDSATLDALVRESYHHVFVDAADDKGFWRRTSWYWGGDKPNERLTAFEKDSVNEVAAAGANYLFLNSSFGYAKQAIEGTGHEYRHTITSVDKFAMQFTQTRMALIGKREEKQLMALFYKGMPKRVEKAMAILGMENPSHSYAKYRETKSIRRAIENFHSVEFYTPRFAAYFPEFLEFALTLPMEDRNPEADRLLFTASPALIDRSHLLLTLYERNDARFPEFAELAGKTVLDEVAAMAAELPQKEQKQALNTWLFGKGYHAVYLEPLELYKTGTPETFMKHFRKQPEVQKEEIITMLMRLDMEERNPDVDTLLDSEFKPLLERVGAQYVGDRQDSAE